MLAFKNERIMRLKWTLLVLLQHEQLKLTLQSITGVTYMDNFDFEERYRDFNECNPFYWYPLHMPERCTDMFEKLIRSRIANRTPVRIVRKKESILESTGQLRQAVRYNGYPVSLGDSYPIYELANEETHEHPISPYEKMLEMLKKDIISEPSAPNVQLLPGLGPVAIYRQPISSKTEFMIKKIAKAYAKAGQETYVDYTPYLPSPYPALSTNQSIIGKVKKIIKANKTKEIIIRKKNGKW